MRVVSLVPSVTETLLDWGVRPIAVTRFCEQPQIRHVGGTKNPDIEAIVALGPDVVVMDREENRIEDHDALVRAGTAVHVTAVRAVEDVGPTLQALGTCLGVDRPLPPLRQPERRDRRAFVPIWRRPWMALGAPTYATSLLERLGVANVYDRSDGPYPTVTLADAASRGPDLVLAPDEPYPFGERHRRQLEEVAPVRFVDGKDLVWWGARTPGALDRLARVLAEWRAT